MRESLGKKISSCDFVKWILSKGKFFGSGRIFSALFRFFICEFKRNDNFFDLNGSQFTHCNGCAYLI